jgi:hypothetical protein
VVPVAPPDDVPPELAASAGVGASAGSATNAAMDSAVGNTRRLCTQQLGKTHQSLRSEGRSIPSGGLRLIEDCLTLAVMQSQTY